MRCCALQALHAGFVVQIVQNKPSVPHFCLKARQLILAAMSDTRITVKRRAVTLITFISFITLIFHVVRPTASLGGEVQCCNNTVYSFLWQ